MQLGLGAAVLVASVAATVSACAIYGAPAGDLIPIPDAGADADADAKGD